MLTKETPPKLFLIQTVRWEQFRFIIFSNLDEIFFKQEFSINNLKISSRFILVITAVTFNFALQQMLSSPQFSNGLRIIIIIWCSYLTFSTRSVPEKSNCRSVQVFPFTHVRFRGEILCVNVHMEAGWTEREEVHSPLTELRSAVLWTAVVNEKIEFVSNQWRITKKISIRIGKCWGTSGADWKSIGENSTILLKGIQARKGWGLNHPIEKFASNSLFSSSALNKVSDPILRRPQSRSPPVMDVPSP